MLKVTAKELDICIIALHQLSRAVETRGGDKRPIMSDLRDSGNLEQDADAVMFLYRPDYYGFEMDDAGQPTSGTLEMIVAKNREGETGIQVMGYNPAIGKLSSSIENNFAPF
jgi:replicative DNA helicase